MVTTGDWPNSHRISNEAKKPNPISKMYMQLWSLKAVTAGSL